MTPTLLRAAHTILLPAFADTGLSDSIRHFLANGGCSILIGETRDEYVSRVMSRQRRHEEQAEDLYNLTRLAKNYCLEMIIAIDQEIGGICRMHDLVPAFPAADKLPQLATYEFHSISATIARRSKDLGINCFLSPILDLVTGPNPWLEDRTWTRDPIELARISCTFIKAVQQEGVIACAKHFPGYGTIERDPAIDAEARNDQQLAVCHENMDIFKQAISSGVAMIMAGPAIVSSLDPEQPASTSPLIIGSLKDTLGFTGVVVSDDLDAQATLLGRSLADTAIQSLNSGCDLLLVADAGATLKELPAAISRAVSEGVLSEQRLLQAAESVQSLAGDYE